MSAERVPNVSLERVEETEVIYVAMPHAVRLPPAERRAVVEVRRDYREDLFTNVGALIYAVGFTICAGLFFTGLYVLKSALFGSLTLPILNHNGIAAISQDRGQFGRGESV